MIRTVESTPFSLLYPQDDVDLSGLSAIEIHQKLSNPFLQVQKRNELFTKLYTQHVKNIVQFILDTAKNSPALQQQFQTNLQKHFSEKLTLEMLAEASSSESHLRSLLQQEIIDDEWVWIKSTEEEKIESLLHLTQFIPELEKTLSLQQDLLSEDSFVMVPEKESPPLPSSPILTAINYTGYAAYGITRGTVKTVQAIYPVYRELLRIGTFLGIAAIVLENPWTELIRIVIPLLLKR